MADVTSLAQWSADRHIGQVDGTVVLEFETDAPTRAAEICRVFAQTCIESRRTRALILLAENIPGGEHGLREAFTTIVLAGAGAGFRLALVAATERVEYTYRNAQRDLCAAQIDTQFFAGADEALRWLGAAPARARA